MKDILKGAKFVDKFVCRNGDIALYLWTNNKEGYSLQLEKEKKPHHYDVDGHWYAQTDKENPYDVVSKVDDKAVLGDVLKDLQKTENDFAEMITMENIYKKTIAYDLEKVVINEDDTTSHLHSDSFLDKHPERRETPQFTEEEEIEQANFMVVMAKIL